MSDEQYSDIEKNFIAGFLCAGGETEEAKSQAKQYSENLKHISCKILYTDDHKAALYYKAIALKQRPQFVPSRLNVLHEQFGDFPFRGAGISPGEHECQCNNYGAVIVTARDGKMLGLRLDEFEPVEWRENA